MAYDTIDASTDSGEVYYTIVFNFSNVVYRFTSRNTSISISGQTYAPGLLDFEGVTDDIVLRSIPEVNITMDKDNDLFNVIVENALASTMTVQLVRRYVGETETRRIFNGYLDTYNITPSTMNLACRTILSKLENDLVFEPISPMCRFTLYDRDCGVTQNSYRTNISSFTMSDNTITVPAGILNTTEDYYKYGLFVCNNNYREIFASNETTLTIARGFNQGTASSAIAYAGCDHTRLTCQTKFNNRLRFGGFPGAPIKNNIGRI